jgi:hypothetical protein
LRKNSTELTPYQTYDFVEIERLSHGVIENLIHVRFSITQ